MSTTPPAPAGRATLPPEERFWRRYSPHQEAPLSGIGSLTLHALSAGLLVLAAFLINVWGEKSRPPLTITTVPGGGGDPAGPPAAREPTLREAAPDDADPKVPPGAAASRPDLPKGVPAVRPRLDLPDDRDHRHYRDEIVGKLEGLNRNATKALGPGAPRPGSPGRGGPGDGGGRGPGHGPGDGVGAGPTGTLTRQQKRMLRWTLRFDTRSGQDYLRQLRALGAVLAVPRDGTDHDYQVVRDLSRRPALLQDEDGSEARRISWRDGDPRSVGQLMQALGLGGRRPGHVVAYFPESLEQKLFELERAHARLPEEEIAATVFDVVRTPGGYAPRVASQTRK